MNTTSKPECKFKKMPGGILCLFLTLAMVFPAADVGQAASNVQVRSNLHGASSTSLVAAAQAEGSLTVIGLPNDWCNYGALIQGFTTTYGIAVNSVDPWVSSEEVLQAIRNGILNPSPNTPDVIDVGPGFAVRAQSEGLITPYKVSTWATIPAFMKNSAGYWYGDYYGVIAIAANTTSHNPPSSWQDLLNGSNVGGVALGGDPRISNMGFFAVYAAALANGGSLNNIEPGLQFFKNLRNAGRLLPTYGNGSSLVSGQTPVLLEWSYLALAQRDAHPEAQIEVVIPQPNAVASFYTQAISAYAPHPNAARLWMEYLYSDAGQLAWLEGYCFPARFADLLARNVIPQDLLAQLPNITGAVFPTLDQISVAQTFVDTNWACIVYGQCFSDVPSTHWAWSFIERLYKAGITGGCATNPLRYCPENSVTRAQMAVFLLKARHGAGYVAPGVGSSTGFADVPPTYWAAAWIKQLAAEGITAGCGGGNYCPENPVTRDQMAIFLLRAQYGPSYIPPGVGASTGFGDVPPNYWSAAWIQQLVAEGITAGCGNGNYCPGNPVTRAQMAVFLVKTFSLP